MVTQWNILHNLQGSKKTLGLENKMIFLLESHPHAPSARVDTRAVYRVLSETSRLWRKFPQRSMCIPAVCKSFLLSNNLLQIYLWLFFDFPKRWDSAWGIHFVCQIFFQKLFVFMLLYLRQALMTPWGRRKQHSY